MTELTSDLLAQIRELSPSDDPIDAETDLLLGGYLDSLAVVEVVQWLEDNTGIEIDPGDVTIENFGSVSAMVAFVERPDS